MKLKNLSNIKWIGGKHGKEDRYIDLMPKHKIFVDCMFGSGAIPFYKETVSPAAVTVINDKNDSLINYMLVLRDRPEDLYKMCEGLPFSESLYKKYKWDPEPEDPLERAARFYYKMRLTFSGGGHKYRNGLGLSKTQNKAATLRNSSMLIPKMADMIKNWTILCRDFEEVIDFYDTPETLFFLDPPYVGYENIYAGGFASKDHKRIRDRLESIKGKVMICYYPDDLILDLYGDWNIVEYNTASQIEVREHGDKCPVRTELIIMNYKHENVEQLKMI